MGRLQAAVDRARMAEAAAQADVATEREGKQVLAEEVRLLRQSIAAQEMERLKRQVHAWSCRAGLMGWGSCYHPYVFFMRPKACAKRAGVTASVACRQCERFARAAGEACKLAEVTRVRQARPLSACIRK